MRLLDALLRYAESGACPMHMPGHKRNVSLPGLENPFAIDITEIDGFDNLYEAGGILAEAMARAASLYGSSHSFYLVNGSTTGLLSAIAAAVKRGERILMARNCHRAVYHGAALRGGPISYLMPAATPWGISGAIDPAAVAAALDRERDVGLVVITSPTYEGVVSDVAAIAGIAHKRRVPLLVDAAHGAHLGFSEDFPQNAVKAGADLVVHSLHKTLPSLTQTGLLHLNGDLVPLERVKRQFAVFQTSSPSYLLMASIDACIDRLATEGKALFAAYGRRLSAFYRRMGKLQSLAVLGSGGEGGAGIERDPGRIVILTANGGWSGQEFLSLLRQEHGIELEMALGGYAVAITSLCDDEAAFRRLGDALLALDEKAAAAKPNGPALAIPTPRPVRSIGEAEEEDSHFLPLPESGGKISAEYVYAYPPGIPLLAPGEEIGPALLALLGALEGDGVTVYSSSGRIPAEIRVLSFPSAVDSRHSFC